jgi:predicted RNase H-like HicB family nuclease
MKTVEVIVEHAGNNLSAYIEGAPVITVGNDVKEIEKNMKEAWRQEKLKKFDLL